MPKLLRYNFSEGAVRWFSSYLLNRKHIVRTNNHMSKQTLVQYGVPQGSTLGPLLFIIYVNDLLRELKIVKNNDILIYADDTVLYATDENPLECGKGSQLLLHQLTDWCCMNKLMIGISKTKHTLVPQNRDHTNMLLGKGRRQNSPQ